MLLLLQNTRIHFQQPPFQFTIKTTFPFKPHLPCFQAGLVPQHLSHLEILPLSPLQPFRTFQVCISNSSIHHLAVFFSICYTSTLSHSTNICISPVALRNRTDTDIGWLLGVGLYNYGLICRVSQATEEDPGEVISNSCLKMTPVPRKVSEFESVSTQGGGGQTFAYPAFTWLDEVHSQETGWAAALCLLIWILISSKKHLYTVFSQISEYPMAQARHKITHHINFLLNFDVNILMYKIILV